MLPTKQLVQRVLEQLPDDCTLEDVQYQLYLLEKLSHRIKTADGQAYFIPTDEVARRMGKWLVK